MPISIKSEVGHASLALDFGEVCGNWGELLVELEFGQNRIRTRTHLDGWDALEFARELRQLYESLNGTATLSNCDGTFELIFKVVDRGRGRIRVKGKIKTGPSHYFPDDEWSSSGIETSFAGLVIEQSYLPEIIDAFDDFLLTSGISTKNP